MVSDPSPWKSVNDMLIQNKCWLCEQTFPRGLKKKVFQVSHIIDYYYTRRNTELSESPVADMRTRNLRACYERYKALVSAENPENLEKLEEEFKEIDVEVWMSGLICALNDDCIADMKLILPHETPEPNAAASLSYVINVGNGVHAINGRGDGKECPPGCGCDDPWRFL